MSSTRLVADLLHNCIVVNGTIKFMRSITNDELFEVYKRLSDDLLSCKIPHWKVIGFYHGWDDKHQHTAFGQNDIFGMSLIELGLKMDKVIPVANGGIDPKKGCFYGVDEEIENLHEFDNAYGKSPDGKAANRRTNALMLPTSEIGSLMCDYQGPAVDGENPIDVPYFGTDTIWYTQFSLVDPAKYPTMLLPHVKLCDFTHGGMKKTTTIMFIKRGTGVLDYVDTQALFSSAYELIMPCRTTYDLSKFFTIAYPNGQVNGLKLVYKTEINEDALTTILTEYGKDLMEE